MLACRTEIRGWILDSCQISLTQVQIWSVDLFAIFPIQLLPVVFVLSISRTTAGVPTLAPWDTSSILFSFFLDGLPSEG